MMGGEEQGQRREGKMAKETPIYDSDFLKNIQNLRKMGKKRYFSENLVLPSYIFYFAS